jgi:hypothetical protein
MLGPNRPMAARRDVAPIDGRGAEHFELRKQRKGALGEATDDRVSRPRVGMAASAGAWTLASKRRHDLAS